MDSLGNVVFRHHLKIVSILWDYLPKNINSFAAFYMSVLI